jgi:hypothetical protein
MNWQVIKIRLLLWLRRFVLYGGYLAFVFAVASFLILQIQSVQERLLAHYLERLPAAARFPITFRSFYFSWWDNLYVEGLEVRDPENNRMISASAIRIRFDLPALYRGGSVRLNGISASGADVRLTPIGPDSARNLNLNEWIAELRGADTTAGGKSIPIHIKEISLSKGNFVYENPDLPAAASAFDPSRMQIAIADARLSKMLIQGDTIAFAVRGLRARELNSGLPVTGLQTFFRYSQNAMELYQLRLETERSVVMDTMVFRYADADAWSDFNNRVTLDWRLKNTQLDPADLALFLPQGSAALPPLQISGLISGRVGRLSGAGLELRTGDSEVRGSATLDGLPEMSETFLNIRIADGRLRATDLRAWLPDAATGVIQNLGNFRVRGQFTGYLNDFVANAEINSAAGLIRSDINLKIDPVHVEKTRYRGRLALTDFHLGMFAGDTALFQKVTLQGALEGRGFTLGTADFTLRGQVPHIGIYRYNYRNIETNARFAKEYFNGSLSVDDPNLQARLTGSIDLRNRRDEVKIKGHIDTLFLDRLGWTQAPAFLRTDFDFNFRGLTLDSVRGTAVITNGYAQVNQRALDVPTLTLTAAKTGNRRALAIASDWIEGGMEGNFLLTHLFNDLNDFQRELLLSFGNNRNEIADYYRDKIKRPHPQPYAARFNFRLTGMNPVFELLHVPLETDRNATLDGTFTTGLTTRMHLNTAIDSMRSGNRAFYQTRAELSASKFTDSATVLAIATVQSARQKIASKIFFENFFAEAVWDKDHIDLTLDAAQENVANTISLQAEMDFRPDSLLLRLLPSRIRLLGKPWQVTPDNLVVWSQRTVAVRQLGFVHEDESIVFDGLVSPLPEPQLRADFTNVNLALLNSFSSETFGGRLNGFVSLQQAYDTPGIQNQLTLTDLTLNGFLLGTLYGNNTWIPERKEFQVNFELQRQEQTLMQLEGAYLPGHPTDPLQLDAVFNRADLRIIEPLLKGTFSDLEGTLSGRYAVRGTLAGPAIEGAGKIQQGRVRIDYLNAVYEMEGSLNMTASQIVFEAMQLTDAFGNKGRLEGMIGHRNFDRFRFNIDCEFTRMQVLNTVQKDDTPIYGQAYASGRVNIFGPISNIKISASVKSEKNTRIFIPMGGGARAEKKDFINFFHFADSAKAATAAPAERKQLNPSGFALDLNLEITPDAYAEIIFDIKAGDIIRGRGNGELKLQMDSRGGFNLFGFVEFTEGAYNFTLYDIISKEFTIKPGSNIAWYGDPYQGVLNITASYRQLVSLGPILQDQTVVNTPAIRRKYPVEVLLKLDGPMLLPNITFDLSAPELPDNVIAETAQGGQQVPLKFQFAAFKARADEQELKKQVFSIIVLRRFSPPDAFNTSGSIQNSVSEFLSNQLSYWLSQMDQNLEIDFDLDLGTMNQEAFNTFQLRLSYSMLNGRLRITRDGTIGNTQAASLASVAGDITVDYLLTPDGRFKVKMYSRSNLNAIQTTFGTQVPLTAGVSLLHTQSFGELRDLLRSARERRRRELELETGAGNEVYP